MIGAITAGLYGTGVPPVTSSYESIATVTVGSGGTSSISFSSIASTYKHLQIRGIARTVRSSFFDGLGVRFNSDSGANYTYHDLSGSGSAAASGGGTGSTFAVTNCTGNSGIANGFTPFIIDVLDYGNTSKNKTVRSLSGFDNNSTTGYIFLQSSVWLNTSAISSITIVPTDSASIKEFSQFALYGIKG